MNRVKFLLSISVSIILTHYSYGQYYELPEEKPTPRLSFTEINFSSSNWSTQPTTEGLVDFRKLAPQSELINTNLEGYELSTYGNLVLNSGANINLGFNIRSNWKEKYGQRLRVGFAFAQSELFSAAYSRIDRFPYDTLISPTTGTVEIRDSVQTQSLFLSHSTRALMLDACYLAVLNPNKRWSFYTGFGLSVGFAVTSETTIIYTLNNHTESNGQYIQSNGSSGNSDERQTEMFRNKRSISMAAMIPFGVDFRIGKNRQFWMPIHLFYEIQPTLRLNNVPEVGLMSQFPVAQNFGLRVTI